MSYKLNDIGIKNRIYYILNNTINIENRDLNKVKINEKSYEIFLFISFDM